MAGDATGAARARAALELVPDPRLDLYKRVREDLLGPAAREELDRRCAALLRHCWGLVTAAYGVRPGRPFYAVHRAGDRLNCLLLTERLEEARAVARWWAGPAVEVTPVPADDGCPEACIALAVALHWKPPAWLEKKDLR